MFPDILYSRVARVGSSSTVDCLSKRPFRPLLKSSAISCVVAQRGDGLSEQRDGGREGDMNPPKRLRSTEDEAETPTGGQREEEEEEEEGVDVVSDRLTLSRTQLTLKY